MKDGTKASVQQRMKNVCVKGCEQGTAVQRAACSRTALERGIRC